MVQPTFPSRQPGAESDSAWADTVPGEWPGGPAARPDPSSTLPSFPALIAPVPVLRSVLAPARRGGVASAPAPLSGPSTSAPFSSAAGFAELSFPELNTDAVDDWRWPRPPFDWPHVVGPDIDTEQPCTLFMASGTTVDGTMQGFRPAARTLQFRTASGSQSMTVAFARFRHLALTTPLHAAAVGGSGVTRLPLASQSRSYRFDPPDGSAGWRIDSLGHVEHEEGLFLFLPIEEDRSLQRVFVPASSYTRFQAGHSAEDEAAERWLADPVALLEAINRQDRLPVLPIGQSLLDLGMITQAQLDRALAAPRGDKPLGESLVDMRIITAADLQTALAHKMGVPLVDLTRFPVDPNAARKLSLRTATVLRALPLMIDGQRLVVAIDRLSRLPRLRELQVLAGHTVVPVLASKSQIKVALANLSQADMWAFNVPGAGTYFPTTT